MKRALSALISIGILIAIYLKVDFRNLLSALANTDPLWLVVSLGMVIPLTLFSAWRLQQLMPHRGQLGFGESNKLILLASVLNLVLPSKMGDIVKAYFMKDKGGMSGSLALSLVVFEKVCDMLSLLIWCVFGLLMYPSKDLLFWGMTAGVLSALVFSLLLLCSKRVANLFFDLACRFAPGKIGGKLCKLKEAWGQMHGYFWASKRQLFKVAATSIFIWYLHLLQIWMFVLALKVHVPFIQNLALAPLGLLAGLLPLTFAGVGTRDAAFVLFYKPYFAENIAAALGVLCTGRYVLPALGGLPFISSYYRMVADEKAAKAATAAEAVGANAPEPAAR